MRTWTESLIHFHLYGLLPRRQSATERHLDGKSSIKPVPALLPARPLEPAATEGMPLPPKERNALARRRGEAMRSMFPKMFSWFAGRWDMHGMREVDAYLSQATSVYDLEERIRHLERRRHFSAF
jgi:hypothetical protein